MDLPENLKPLFVDWLEEEIGKLSIRQHKFGMTLSRALDNLLEYEGPLSKPTDLKQVKYVGPKTIENFTKRLHKYCLEYGYNYPNEPLPASSTSESKKRTNSSNANDGDEESTKKKTKRTYVPRKRSGGYAILLVLLEFDRDERGMSRDAISSNATPYCSSSFENNPGANQLHSAWNSVKTLINNELVRSQGRPVKYFLTEEGKTLAQNLKATDNIIFRNEMNSPERARQMGSTERPVIAPQNRPIYRYEGVPYHFWEKGTFEIIFIIDSREVRAKTQRDYFLVKLQQHGVKSETRALTVGDGLWIARNKLTNEEVVLNYIIERKRLDDLASSIKDGRYNEQKIRLKRTGVENIFYLIEEFTSSDVQQMADAIQTSISMAMTNSNFHCIRTKGAEETIQFIKETTTGLKEFYDPKRLLVIDPQKLESQQDYANVLNEFRAKFKNDSVECTHIYDTFDTMLSKSNLMTAREMFVRMLMTIRGVSLEKAILIQKEFKTPRSLIQEFEKNDPELGRKYGKKIQEAIGDLFQNV
jgi:crossover junction endonuclease MUS81